MGRTLNKKKKGMNIFMKKRYCICFFIIVLVLFSNSCNRSRSQQENVLGDAQIGVIETSGDTKTSGIVFYDAELNPKESLPLKYATVGDMFCNPVVYEGKLYVIPQGYDYEKEEEKILEIDLSNLKKKVYKIKHIAMYGLTVDDENIYTCSNLNNYSYIGKCNKKTGKVEEQKIEDIYITQILAYQGKLYAFGTKIYTDKTKENRKNMSYIYIYDSKFKLIDKINLSQYGDIQNKIIAFEDKIYFSNTYNSETELPNNTVCSYSVKDKKIETITLEQDYPLDLNIYNNMLIVSHFDLILDREDKKGSISFVDLETRKQKNYELKHAVDHMVRVGEYLYILSDTAIYSNTKLYKYRIDGMELELIKEVEAEKMYPDNYFTSLFVVEK